MFNWITTVISSFGYAGVAALTFLENLFPPIPSELIIPLAGFVAAKGSLRLDVVIGDGTWRAMRGRGGVRATPVDDGVLRFVRKGAALPTSYPAAPISGSAGDAPAPTDAGAAVAA